MTDYLNLICAYLIGYQVIEAIIDFNYFAPIGALIRVVFLIIPVWYVCGVAIGGTK